MVADILNFKNKKNQHTTEECGIDDYADCFSEMWDEAEEFINELLDDENLCFGEKTAYLTSLLSICRSELNKLYNDDGGNLY